MKSLQNLFSPYLRNVRFISFMMIAYGVLLMMVGLVGEGTNVRLPGVIAEMVFGIGFYIADDLIFFGFLILVIDFMLERKFEQFQNRMAIAQLGSSDSTVAIQAARTLRSSGLLSNGSLQHINIQGANLAQADLADSDLSHANLSNANLRESDLTNANLAGIVARNTDFREALLRNVDLTGADLKAASFVGAYLLGAKLQGADLRGVDFTSAVLTDANMKEALFDQHTLLPYSEDQRPG